MNDFERIQLEHKDSINMMRFYNIVFNNDKTTQEEIEELIEYFKNKEEYKFCKHLKIKLDELMDN